MATIVTNKFRRVNSIFPQCFLIVLFVLKVYTTGKNAKQVRNRLPREEEERATEQVAKRRRKTNVARCYTRTEKFFN